MTATSISKFPRPAWQATAIFTLALWLGGSLLLDLVVMPTLYTSGMMAQADFATTGYSLFWIFNRLEVICAALVLTSLLVMRAHRDRFAVVVSGTKSRWAIGLSVLLLSVALAYTYLLSPEMSALGVQLNLFATTPEVSAAMDQLHMSYWGLETIKLLASGLLLGLCYRDLSVNHKP
ncbi:MAG: DUF4149 domain-containing protein [Cyanothece sp. SIO1E1]|nr:DUF4149 domain-containing protein [Cyanothece sp. SIO1E1]